MVSYYFKVFFNMYILRAVLFILMIYCIASPVQAMASENACAELSLLPPVIEIIDHEDDVIYDFNINLNTLQRVKRQYEQQFSKFVVAGDTLGLTIGRYNYNLSLSTGFKRTGFLWGGYCPEIKKVSLTLNHESKIYVAKEYAGNKCSFDVIFNHELDHHQVNVTNKKKYFGWLKSDLAAVIEDIAKQYPPVPYSNINKLSDRIKHDVKDIVQTYIDKMNYDTKIQNDKLDTRAEYRRLNADIKKCRKKR